MNHEPILLAPVTRKLTGRNTPGCRVAATFIEEDEVGKRGSIIRITDSALKVDQRA